MRNLYFSIFMTILLVFATGCSGAGKDSDNPEMQVDADVIKIFSSPDLKDFLSQVYTKDRSEFTFYIDALKKDSVNKGTRQKLIEILQEPGNNDYYVATMLYLMAKAGIKEAYPLVKSMLYHPDAYVKFRCLSAFSMLADKTDRNLLLPLVSEKEKFPKVRKQATEAFYAMISANDFDELFEQIKNPEGMIKTDEERKKFFMAATKYCLQKKLDEQTRKEKEGEIIVLLGETSEMADEFILDYFKGRLTSKAFKLLVEMYCDATKTRKIHVDSFGEIHRLMLTRKDDLDLKDLNANFVNTLIKDLTEFEKYEDIIPVDVEFILEDFAISSDNQLVLHDFVSKFDLQKDSDVSLKCAYTVLLEKGDYNNQLQDVMKKSYENKMLMEINLKALESFVNRGVKTDNIAALLKTYMFEAKTEQTANFCAKLLAKLNNQTVIAYFLEGLKNQNSIATEASAIGLINLPDKSYFTEIIREKELVDKILKNENMDKHNIISTLKVFGDMGSSAVDAKWIEQYCPYKNQKDVQNAIEAALIEIDFRERNN